MNTIWSDHIQGVMTLYLSRKLRFHDLFSGQYKALFSLDGGKDLKILEIGCGPGALAGALRRWYPRASITAIDRDSRFIDFARANVEGVEFLEGDAAALPFEDGSVDVTISYTVCEHVPPDSFFAGQRRVLKEGGVCLVLSARRGVRHTADCLAMTEEERRFWEEVSAGDDTLEKYGVGKYHMTEQELPRVMEAYGFSRVSTGYAVADLTPDDPNYSPAMAGDMINAGRYGQIEALRSTRREQASQLIDLVNRKYDERLALYRSGQKQWDTETSITLVVRGVKEG